MTWQDTEFTIQGLADQYCKADKFVWYFTECFCASRVKSEVMVGKRRPHTAVCLFSITNFVVLWPNPPSLCLDPSHCP
jgi:hypothetical protein